MAQQVNQADSLRSQLISALMLKCKKEIFRAQVQNDFCQKPTLNEKEKDE